MKLDGLLEVTGSPVKSRGQDSSPGKRSTRHDVSDELTVGVVVDEFKQFSFADEVLTWKQGLACESSPPMTDS